MTEAERQIHNLQSKMRRETLRSAGLCINGARHGASTHGVRCDICHAKRKPAMPQQQPLERAETVAIASERPLEVVLPSNGVQDGD